MDRHGIHTSNSIPWRRRILQERNDHHRHIDQEVTTRKQPPWTCIAFTLPTLSPGLPPGEFKRPAFSHFMIALPPGLPRPLGISRGPNTPARSILRVRQNPGVLLKRATWLRGLGTQCDTWAQFHRAAKHTNLLSMKLPAKFPHDFQDEQTTAECKLASNIQQMEICLIILFLSRKKFHAKQFLCVLSITIKLLIVCSVF